MELKERQHCNICDDGGFIVLCSVCDAACCYNEEDDEVVPGTQKEDLAISACITFPKGYIKDKHRVFLCPTCLSKDPGRAIDVSYWLCLCTGL